VSIADTPGSFAGNGSHATSNADQGAIHVNDVTEVGRPGARPGARKWLLASFLAYALCLALAPISIHSGHEVEPWGNGLVIVLIGWMGLHTYPEWLANPLLWSAWLLIGLRSSKAGTVCAGAALALALCFLMRDRIMADEAGHFSPIASWDAGYWLWAASMALACIVGLQKMRHE